MSYRRLIAFVSALIILSVGISAMVYAYGLGPTYDGSSDDMYALYLDPTEYDNSNPEGIDSIIVNTNLEQTKAANVVAAVVFDYRGFDTIGESFILLCAISAAHIILHKKEDKKESEVTDNASV